MMVKPNLNCVELILLLLEQTKLFKINYNDCLNLKLIVQYSTGLRRLKTTEFPQRSTTYSKVIAVHELKA